MKRTRAGKRIAAYVRKRAADAERVATRGGEADADLWRQRIDNIADEIEQGMHQ